MVVGFQTLPVASSLPLNPPPPSMRIVGIGMGIRVERIRAEAAQVFRLEQAWRPERGEDQKAEGLHGRLLSVGLGPVVMGLDDAPFSS